MLLSSSYILFFVVVFSDNAVMRVLFFRRVFDVSCRELCSAPEFFSPICPSHVTSVPFLVMSQVLLSVFFVLVLVSGLTEGSIGYFESYGWPSYGIVKPFWMTPFSAHPSRAISRFSRKHDIVSAGIVKARRRRRSICFSC